MYLYGLFLVSDFVRDLLFLCYDEKNLEKNLVDITNVIDNAVRAITNMSGEIVCFFILYFLVFDFYHLVFLYIICLFFYLLD